MPAVTHQFVLDDHTAGGKQSMPAGEPGRPSTGGRAPFGNATSADGRAFTHLFVLAHHKAGGKQSMPAMTHLFVLDDYQSRRETMPASAHQFRARPDARQEPELPYYKLAKRTFFVNLDLLPNHIYEAQNTSHERRRSEPYDACSYRRFRHRCCCRCFRHSSSFLSLLLWLMQMCAWKYRRLFG